MDEYFELFADDVYAVVLWFLVGAGGAALGILFGLVTYLARRDAARLRDGDR